MIEYRQLTKLVGTAASLPEHVCEATGRIHASFHQAVASTGRLSSSDPNLQNIPFAPMSVGNPPGVCGRRRQPVGDSGLFPNRAAHLAHLRVILPEEAFELGADIHTAVASQTFDVEPEEVDDTQRSTAKMINFGIVYGITAFGLSRRLNHAISPGEAQQVIDDYKARFVGIDRFLAACVQEAKDTGYVRTILGRRRPIEGIDQRNPMLRQRAEQYAINTVVQVPPPTSSKWRWLGCPIQVAHSFSRGAFAFANPRRIGAGVSQWLAEALQISWCRPWRGLCPIWRSQSLQVHRSVPLGLRPNRASGAQNPHLDLTPRRLPRATISGLPCVSRATTWGGSSIG